MRVRSRCEKLAAAALTARGFEVLAAVAPQRRVWVDRVRTVEMPLFPGYIFARFDPKQRIEIERTAGVACIVHFSDHCCPVDDFEIDSIRRVLGSGLDIYRAPFFGVGKFVSVKHGALAGTRGVVVEVKNRFRLVVSVTLLQRSVAVEIDEAILEPLWTPAPAEANQVISAA
ncbi:MAG: hypothetical protein K2X03_30430 [Bryobacteraceae bacterium]|nr:hypothetical protein [Bryobacteraceae bacterium]